jgi:hypothetical protein
MTNTTTRTMRFAAATTLVALALVLVAGFAPVDDAVAAANIGGVFRNRLSAETHTAALVADSTEPLAKSVRTAARTATKIEAPAPAATAAVRTSSTRSSSASTTSSSTRSTASAPVDETARARSILAGYIAKYPILSGSTVSFGDAKGYQAICYYQSGRIVISPTHTSSLERIIAHEVGHILDWRDNGVIDWGENIPAL